MKWIVAAALLAGLGGFLAYTARLSGGGRGMSPALDSGQAGSAGSAQCAGCHGEIYREWRQDQHAGAWTDDAFKRFSEDYARVECLSCHAPRPMLETGIAGAPLLRAANRESGVDCIACHVKDGKTHGTLGSGASCGGVLDPQLKTSQACFHCHSAHNLFKEFLASEQAARGMTCQDCHMENVTRAVADGQPPRRTRRHLFHGGGHDTQALKKTLKLELAIDGQELVVTVANIGAAHGVPGEINNRIVILEVLLGRETAGAYEELAAHREHFRAPPRLARERVPSTQLMPGTPRVLRYVLPSRSGQARATLSYKLEASGFEPPVLLTEASLAY